MLNTLKNIIKSLNDISIFLFIIFIFIKSIYKKIFIQYEINDLIFDIILFMIMLVIFDNVFKSQIRLIKNIFWFRMRTFRKNFQF